jgi:hypothetical protein
MNTERGVSMSLSGRRDGVREGAGGAIAQGEVEAIVRDLAGLMVWANCVLVMRLMDWCFWWVDRAVWKTFDARSLENSDSEVEVPAERVSP